MGLLSTKLMCVQLVGTNIFEFEPLDTGVEGVVATLDA